MKRRTPEDHVVLISMRLGRFRLAIVNVRARIDGIHGPVLHMGKMTN